MRQCYEDINNKDETTVAGRACEYSQTLGERFSAEKQYARFIKLMGDHHSPTAEVDDWLSTLEVEEHE